MKNPKPWYWTARKAWYVQLNGKQKKLHKDEKEANKEFYRIMASEGRLDEKDARGIRVADAVEAMLASVDHHRESTRRLYGYNLAPLAVRFAGRRLDSMKFDECSRFVREFAGRGTRQFGEASRYLMMRYIKTFFRWARDSGLIQLNPLHGKDNPWKSLARPRVMAETEYLAIMSDRKLNDQFKEVMEFLWRTGARPGEIACICARHLDAKLPIVRLQPTEHKTGTKTGLQREIMMPPDLMDRLRSYAVERPKGTLLRNRKGNAWTQCLISDCFHRVKVRLGMPDLVIYMARHAFITRLLDGGKSPAIVAKLAGHTHAETIQKVYYHPDTKAMMDMVAEDSEGQQEELQTIREGVAEARRKHRSKLGDQPVSE